MKPHHNPKVEALLNHVGTFEPQDFVDAAVALLDQAGLDARELRTVLAVIPLRFISRVVG